MIVVRFIHKKTTSEVVTDGWIGESCDILSQKRYSGKCFKYKNSIIILIYFAIAKRSPAPQKTPCKIIYLSNTRIKDKSGIIYDQASLVTQSIRSRTLVIRQPLPYSLPTYSNGLRLVITLLFRE